MTDSKRSEQKYIPKILVVDDEKRIREGCSAVLSEEGFQVAVAEEGASGLRLIDGEHFDVILLDLMMPGISGMDFLARVKTTHPDTAIIVITGYATIEHSIEAMKNGAFDFIPKPFTPDQLRLVVAKALEYTRTLQDVATEKSRIRTLVNHMSDGVMATDSFKRIILANPAFMKMVSYEGDELIGYSCDDLSVIEPLRRMIDQVLDLPENEFSVLSEEFTPHTASTSEGGNGEICLSAHCLPFRDRQNRTLGAITLLHDITTLKRMDHLKSQFVSLVAHEIRSPINSILMQLKVVLDGLAGDLTEKQESILQRASEKLNGLVEMATELLDLSKIESGLFTQEMELTNLSEILEDQISFHKAAADKKGIQLRKEALPELPLVLANRRNMDEVFSNLITNAIKYSPEGAEVSVSAEVGKDTICVRIKDNGYGIPKEDLEKIFERFYRVKNERTRMIIGTGLGLPIVKSIVDAHNGRISVESEQGAGSCFSVYLPIHTTH